MVMKDVYKTYINESTVLWVFVSHDNANETLKLLHMIQIKMLVAWFWMQEWVLISSLILNYFTRYIYVQGSTFLSQ